MNRRLFLQRLAYGAVATAALVSLPASIVKAAPALVEPARLWACERMRAVFNAWCQAHPHQWPTSMVIGRDLYEMYEGELTANMRWVSTDAEPDRFKGGLLFKGVRVWYQGRGYGISMYGEDKRRNG